MDAMEKPDVVKRIEEFNLYAGTAIAARFFVCGIARDAIRDAGGDPHGIPVLGRVDGNGRVTFYGEQG